MAKKKTLKAKKTRYLKHAVNGNVCIRTKIMAKRDVMLPCDKDGVLISRADERHDLSDLSLREIIESSRKKSEVIDIGARYDLGFSDKMKLKEMKESLIKALIEKDVIDEEDPDDVDDSGEDDDDDED